MTSPSAAAALDTALQYAESLQGVLYGYWTGNTVPYDDSTPFYLGTGPLPTRDTLEEQGIVCTGLINLICRHIGGIRIPDLTGYPGGTGAWSSAKIPWRPLFLGQQLPPGTLLLRRYRNFEDQGHMAIVARDGAHILHSMVDPWDPYTQTVRSPGVTLTPFASVADLDYYEVACEPAGWLSN